MAELLRNDQAAGFALQVPMVKARTNRATEPTVHFSHADGKEEGAIAPIVESLTTRESQVLELIAQGLTNGEIAQELIIGKRTVEKHIGHIFAKLGVSSRPKAMLYAIRNGLVAL